MEVPITQFRKDIFALANRALEGETITVAYKGKRLRIVPEIDPKTRFDRLTPLQIINGPLMAGMDEVGRQFAANQLIVAEVLQSADIMTGAYAPEYGSEAAAMSSAMRLTAFS